MSCYFNYVEILYIFPYLKKYEYPCSFTLISEIVIFLVFNEIGLCQENFWFLPKNYETRKYIWVTPELLFVFGDI